MPDMMPLIDDTYAWRRIRDARRAELARRSPDAPVTIEANGCWQAATGVAVSETATALFDTLLPVACGGRDYVLAQLGQSLDGRIATASGHSHYVTGEASRAHLHRLRALVDVVLVGAGTAAADDPRLTVRHVAGDDPVRAVLDPNGRVPQTARVFTDDGPETLHLVAEDRLAAPGATTVIVARDDHGRVTPADVLEALAARRLTRVLVEGGGQTISRFIEAGLVDRLHTVVAPMLIGSGRPALSLAEIDSLAEAYRPACRDHALGADRLYDLDLRREA